MRPWHLFPLTFSIMLGWQSAATGQVTPTPEEQQFIERQQDFLLRREEERREELERQRKLQELTPPDPDEETVPNIDIGDGPCLDVETIRLDGLEDLDPGRYRDVVVPYEGRCLTIEGIQEILTLLNDAFRGDGYVTTRAYLAPQELGAGELIITVIEGRVEDLSLNEGSFRDQSKLFFAFPTADGDVLDLRDLEQGLDQINRLRSSNATLQIEPGVEPGGSRVRIADEVGDRVQIELGRENSGTNLTGILQNVASFGVEDFLGIADSWRVDYSQNARDFGGDRRSRSFSGSASIPFGYNLFSYRGSYYRYGSLIEGEIVDFQTDGVSTSHKAEVSRVIHRDDKSKTRLDLGLTAKRTENFIEGVLVEVSSRRLTILNAGLAHSTRIFDGVAFAMVGYERGLRILNALEDPDNLSGDQPRAQFDKWTLDLAYSRILGLGSQQFLFNTSSFWQYSLNTLFGSERLGVGGQFSVRGFREDTLAGDTGGYWRNELAWQLPPPDLGMLSAVVGRLEPYIAFDWGWIKTDRSEQRERGVVQGGSIGLRNYADYASFDFTVSRALASPDFLETESNVVNFRAVVTFSF